MADRTHDDASRHSDSGVASLAGGLVVFTVALLAIAMLALTMTGTTPTP